MPKNPYWIPPDPLPTQPPTNVDHGYPEYPGLDIQRIYWNSLSFAAAQQFRGINYLDPETGEIQTSWETVNMEIYNDYLRQFYFFVRRYRRFALIVTALIGWRVGSDQQAEGAPGFNPMEVYEFQASGSGASVNIEWPEAQGFGDHDLRGMVIVSGEALFSAGCSGMYIMDERSGYNAGISELADITLNGLSGGTHSATLFLNPNKPLKADRHGKIWIVRHNLAKPYPYPHLHLTDAERTDPLPCHYCIEQQCSIFRTFKQHYPDEPMAAAITSDNEICTRMNELNQEELDLFDTFGGCCQNIDCRFYKAWEVTIPSASDLYKFLIGRGEYFRRGLPPSRFNSRRGSLGWDGLFTLHDLPTIPRNEKTLEENIDFLGKGVLRFDTGETGEDGFREYKTFADYMAEGGGSDSVGLIGSAFPNLDKQAPDGGISSMPPFDKIQPGTPGFTLARAMGIRRCGSPVLSSPTAQPTGPGDDDVQRTFHKQPYVSRLFAVPLVDTEGYTRKNETRVKTYAGQQNFPTGSKVFDIEFQVPKAGDSILDARAVRTKNVGGIADLVTVDGEEMTLFMRLGVEESKFPIIDESAASEAASIWDCGGNTVASEAARSITNATSSRLPYTDPEAMVYPGDVLDIAGLPALVLEAEAFGGPIQVGAREPHPDAGGIPPWLTTSANHKRQDRIVLSLAGYSGSRLLEAFFGGVVFEEEVSIDSVAHSAHGPAAASYAPTLIRVDGEGVVVNVTGDADWDAVTGTAYIDSSAWPVGEYRLLWSGYVFDTRRTLPISNLDALTTLLDGFTEGFISQGGLTTSGIFITADFSPENNVLELVAGHYDFWLDRGGFSRPSFERDFVGFGGSRNFPAVSFISHTEMTVDVFFIQKTVGSGLYRIGAGEFPTEDFFRTQIDNFQFQDFIEYSFVYSGTVPMTRLQPAGTLYGSGEIKKVSMRFEVGGPTLTTVAKSINKIDFDAAPNKGAYLNEQTHTTVETNNPKFSISIVVFEDVGTGGQEKLKIEFVGNSTLAQGQFFEVDGVQVLRGDVEITESYKLALDFLQQGEKKQIGFIPGGPFAKELDSAADDWKKALSSWIGDWSLELDGPILSPPLNGLEWTAHTSEYSFMTMKDFKCSSLEIQTKKETLADGVNFYAGANDVETFAPNLMAQPQP